MGDEDRASTEPTQARTMRAVVVPPSGETEKPEGLAFDVEKGAGLPGVPVGDQTPKNPGAAHAAQAVRERGGGVGLAVPGDPDRKTEEPAEEASER
jgi:hypothetical protein